uniref:Armadillo-like helical domain-containing protein n=1 Tax=Timema cristinae TaxID=61476 RepID=A0A7R9CC69_TIMCR|nr:unnamed protein product [Timema cristinae]
MKQETQQDCSTSALHADPSHYLHTVPQLTLLERATMILAILDVVRKNYDSLTLKLQDSLDQYERYAEKPRHAAFFTAMVRSVVFDTRQSIDFSSMDLQLVLQEFSSIS